MSHVRLNFSLRTSSRCKSVHLVGSWDGYGSSLPLSRDSDKSGGWKGSFRFNTGQVVPGGSYWYYYVVDGHQFAHDSTRSAVVEPTTGRQLNVLQVPLSGHGDTGSSSRHSSSRHYSSTSSSSRHHGSRHSGSHSTANGRSLSPSQIHHPAPSRAYETAAVRSTRYSGGQIDELARLYSSHRVHDSSSSDDDIDRYSRRRPHGSHGHTHSHKYSSSSSSSRSGDYASSPTSSGSSSSASSPGLSARSSRGSSPSSVSSLGSPIGSSSGFRCSCQRFALTRGGEKMKIDCGGRVCGSDESSSDSAGSSSRRKTTSGSGASSSRKAGRTSHRS